MDFKWSDEQAAVYKEVKEFARKELNKGLAERDRNGIFFLDGWRKCADMGIQGLPIPSVYGGTGSNALTTIYALEALGFGCAVHGLIHVINSHMWGCEIPIWKFGTEKQKQGYLRFLCKGEMIGGHAVTEPDAGSDVFSIKTSARKEGGYYIIDGSKSIVSNAPIADLLIVFAVTKSNHRFLGGISAFIVEKNTPGVTIGTPLEKMGLKTAPIAEVFFDGCRVPMGNLLGNEGSALRVFNETMEWERSCLFACQAGAMERILNICIEYAKNRHQFGQPIGKFQAISTKLADIKINIELGKLILYKIGWLKSHNENVLLESSMAKLFISESLKAAASDAVQIHGAYGYMSEVGIEREFRDSIASTIYSGTSEIQRNIISKFLGL